MIKQCIANKQFCCIRIFNIVRIFKLQMTMLAWMITRHLKVYLYQLCFVLGILYALPFHPLWHNISINKSKKAYPNRLFDHWPFEHKKSLKCRYMNEKCRIIFVGEELFPFINRPHYIFNEKVKMSGLRSNNQLG